MKRLFFKFRESKDLYLVMSNDPKPNCIKIVFISSFMRIGCSQEGIFSLLHAILKWISKFISQKWKENPYKSTSNPQHKKDLWATLFEAIIVSQIFHRLVKPLMSIIEHGSKVELKKAETKMFNENGRKRRICVNVIAHYTKIQNEM